MACLPPSTGKCDQWVWRLKESRSWNLGRFIKASGKWRVERRKQGCCRFQLEMSCLFALPWKVIHYAQFWRNKRNSTIGIGKIQKAERQGPSQRFHGSHWGMIETSSGWILSLFLIGSSLRKRRLNAHLILLTTFQNTCFSQILEITSQRKYLGEDDQGSFWVNIHQRGPVFSMFQRWSTTAFFCREACVSLEITPPPRPVVVLIHCGDFWVCLYE